MQDTKNKRYTLDCVYNTRFYQMPKFLFENECCELSNDARVLYALLRDRHDLSMMNNWINDKNEVYMIYTRNNLQEIMGLSAKTVKKAFDHLKSIGLLEEERMGFNRPNRIYLTNVSVENTGYGKCTIPLPVDNSMGIRKNGDMQNVEFTWMEACNLRPNDTDLNHTDFIQTEFKSINHDDDDGTIDEKLNYKLQVKIEEISNEIRQNKGIPYEYKRDMDKMRAAIHILTNWQDHSQRGYFSESTQQIYLLMVECLYEMAIEDKTAKYNGSAVTYARIIEMINQNIDWSHGGNTIFEFVDVFVHEFEKNVKSREITSLKAYMKSCIWSSFSTYKVKLYTVNS